MRIHSYSISFLLYIGLLASCGGREDESIPTTQNTVPTSQTETNDSFTVIPLETTDFISLIPLGNLNPSGHVFPTDHHYFVLTNPGTEVPVKSPGEITVEKIAQMEHLTDGFIDYSLTIRLTDTVTAKFGHLSTLSSMLLNQAGQIPLGSIYTTGGKEYRYSSISVEIEITAGIEIGSTGANPGMLALDFGVYDESSTPLFANPTRIESMGDYYKAVNALNYFTETQKAVLETYCGNWDGSVYRTIAPLGGNLSQDIPGTAQGLWFREGESTYPQDPHIALVHDNVDPTIPVLSIGTSIPGLNSGTYPYTVETSGTTNRDFGDIEPNGQIYAFQSFNNGEEGIILIQLSDENSLKIERIAPGSTSPWAFSGNETTFIR